MMLILVSFHWTVVAAEVIVIPRSFSSSMWSMTRAFTLDFLDAVDAAGVVEHALGESRLARVDVGGDADIPIVSQVFHFQGTLSRQTRGGTPVAWATNYTASWRIRRHVNP